MGQKPSKPLAVATDIVSSSLEYPPTAKIHPGAYIIRNKASGTVLHITTPPESVTGEHCDVVGWEQENEVLSTMERQIWWIEWDVSTKAYIIGNVNMEVVLDVTSREDTELQTGKKGAEEREKHKTVCARPRVMSLASARSSLRSSRRSSMVVLQRADLEETPTTLIERESSIERIKGQRWILKRVQSTSESFSIHNLRYPSFSLDLDWGNTDNNTKVQLCTRTGVNHQQWNFVIPHIPSMYPPIGSWVMLRNRTTDALLHHVDKDYPPAGVKLQSWENVTSRREFWGLQWCFAPIVNEKGHVRWYIKNRLTGTFLEHIEGRTRGESVKAEGRATGIFKEWKATLLTASPRTGGKMGMWSLENGASGCALDHHGGKSIQCYAPGVDSQYRQWVILEASSPLIIFGSSQITTPLSALDPLPTLSSSCTSLGSAICPSSSTLLPLIMPSGASFHYVEPSTWPLPACAPASRDILGHEERCFFELLSRIETQLLLPAPDNRLTAVVTSSAPATPATEDPPILPPQHTGPTIFPTLPQTKRSGSIRSLISIASVSSITRKCKRKRILGTTEGWTSWAFGYSKGGNMTNWNNLVESEVVRRADRRDRYIVSFYEGVAIIRELLEKYYDNQTALVENTAEGGMVVLPSRITWLVVLAGISLEKIIKLRALGLEIEDGNLDQWDHSDAQKSAREVNMWVLKELERVQRGLWEIEKTCRGSMGRKEFIIAR